MKIKIGKMTINPREIVEAYLTKFTATVDQKTLAEQRLTICSNCSDRKHVGEGNAGFWKCDICGCVLSGKAFTREENACPVGKWAEVDRTYFNARSEKAKKSGKLT